MDAKGDSDLAENGLSDHDSCTIPARNGGTIFNHRKEKREGEPSSFMDHQI